MAWHPGGVRAGEITCFLRGQRSHRAWEQNEDTAPQSSFPETGRGGRNRHELSTLNRPY